MASNKDVFTLVEEQEQKHSDLLDRLARLRTENDLPYGMTVLDLARQFESFYPLLRGLPEETRALITKALGNIKPWQNVDRVCLEKYRYNVIDQIPANLRDKVGEALLRISFSSMEQGVNGQALLPLRVTALSQSGIPIELLVIEPLRVGERRIIRPEYAEAVAIVKTLYGPRRARRTRL